jgi:hypothetical protein
MAGYIGATPVPQATQHREAFTATANQVSFATAGYTPQFIDIYLNGVKLAPSDYVATNGSDIVLATGAATGDILEYVAYTPFEVANQTFTGTTTLTDSGAAPLVVNRTTSDGDITTFQKNGTTVGSIGSISGDMFLATGVAGIRLTDSVPDIRPVLSDGSNSDATTNLGAGGDRFKDLYLSGGVYLGGIGAANYLDDYEEGTWTPNSSWTISDASYVKIGKFVTITMDLISASTTNTITNLPFTCVNTTGVGIYTANVDFAAGTTAPTMVLGGNTIYFRSVGDNVNFSAMSMKVGSVVHASITYKTS